MFYTFLRNVGLVSCLHPDTFTLPYMEMMIKFFLCDPGDISVLLRTNTLKIQGAAK